MIILAVAFCVWITQITVLSDLAKHPNASYCIFCQEEFLAQE